MKYHLGRALTVLLLLVLVSLPQAQDVVSAQSSDTVSIPENVATSYDLSWWTVDGGGGVVDDSDYTLSNTMGQPDAAVWTGGNYTLVGGFWRSGVVEYKIHIYLPLVLKGS